MPNVKLQVLPFQAGAHASMNGQFVIIGFREPASLDVTYLETASAKVWLERECDTDRYRRLFDSLRRTALSPEDSRVLIDSLIKESG